MHVISLGYAGIEAPDLEPWERLLGPLLGAETTSGDPLTARVDDWERRFIVSQGPTHDVSFVGWEVAGPAALARVVAHLGGLNPLPLTPDELELRRVADGVWCRDPSGLRVEVFHGPAITEPFHSPIETRFATGHLGLGHVVLSVPDLADALRFYCDRLGFRVSDTARLGEVEVAFLRCNPRHHSLALATTKSATRAEHLMLQVEDLDSVGRAFDRCHAAGVAQSTIGRHSNDHMFSFYALTPAGFTFEYGWGGLEITGGPHVSSQFVRESSWGHATLIDRSSDG